MRTVVVGVAAAVGIGVLCARSRWFKTWRSDRAKRLALGINPPVWKALNRLVARWPEITRPKRKAGANAATQTPAEEGIGIDDLLSRATVTVNDRRLKDDDMVEFAALIQSSKVCTSLDLHDNCIEWEGAEVLAAAANASPSLEDLRLSFNRLGDEGTEALADQLQHNQHLTALDLSDQAVPGITSEGAQALGKMLQTNTHLQTLNLSRNAIGDEGVAALAEAVATQGSLTSLDLSSNRLSDAGAQSLVTCLGTNTSLRILNLSKNSISKPLTDELKQAWNRKGVLRVASQSA